MKTAIYTRRLVLCVLLIVSSPAFATASTPNSPDPTDVLNPVDLPEGVSAGDWRSIQSQIEAGKYRAFSDEAGGYVSSNPAHGWQIQFSNDGTTTLIPRDEDAQQYRLGLKLTAVGYQTLSALDQPQSIEADAAIVTYQWNNHLREWWINSPTDLEQWFSIKRRPEGFKAGGRLRLRMNLDTDLHAEPHGDGLRFTNGSGTIITYDGLKVWDAHGNRLTARMQWLDEGLELLINDRAAVYPITIDPSVQQQVYLKASNTGMSDQFGYSVAFSGETLVVGARWEASNATGVDGNQANNSANFAGAAYVFARNGASWTQQAYLKASNTDAIDFFGQSVALSGDTVVVGAPVEDSNATGVDGNQADNSAGSAGAAYVFVRNGASWTQQAYLKASNTNAGDDFGFSVAISENTVLVGAVAEASNAVGLDGNQSDNSADDAGAAYVFVRSGASWTQQAYLKASNTGAGDQFGFSVASSGDIVVVGAPLEHSNATGVDGDQADNSATFAGAAYVFARSGASWTQQAYLKASNTGAGDQFGFSVASSGDTVVVGAPLERSNATGVDGDQADNSAGAAGAVFVFVRSGASWTQQAYLKASNTGVGDIFGRSVALSDDTVVVGARGEGSNATGVDGNQSDNSANDAGAAYVFVRSGAGWTQQAYLKASNTGADDQFGNSVAISGNTVVVGAHREDSNATGVDANQADNSASTAGAVYVFNTTTLGIPARPVPATSFGALIALVLLTATTALGAMKRKRGT